MSALVQLNPSATFAVVALEGDVEWHHIAGALVGLYERPDSRPSLNVLWDIRQISSLVLLPEDLARMKALLSRLHPSLDGGRTAFLVGRSVDEDIARLCSNTGPRRCREYGVFYQLEEALAFLGEPALFHEADRQLVVS